MSRTKKGTKSPTFSYDSRRGRRDNIWHYIPGAVSKKMTHRAERQQNKTKEEDLNE